MTSTPPKSPGGSLWTPFTSLQTYAGVGFAIAYGLTIRFLMEQQALFADTVLVMNLAFLTGVPFVVGFLTLWSHPRSSVLHAMVAPWVPMGAITVITGALGWEGAICIIMGLPLLLASSSLGGLIAHFVRGGIRGIPLIVLLVPFLAGAVESRFPLPEQLRIVASSIDIAAPAGVVWREIVSVREIEPAEMPTPPLYLRMGFPRPLSAEIDREEVGGIRRARFAGGVLFLETVTDLEPDRLLSFRIAAQTDSIPPGTLDEHVTIGGPYFDVLQGIYRIEPLGADSVRLHLESRLRVSTHFNWYASLWADRVMRSIQESILEVQKGRAEAPPIVAR